MTKEKITELILELGRKGFTSEKIGLELKKQGLYAKSTGMKISRILKKENLFIEPDIKSYEKAIEKIKKHKEKHKQDMACGRAFSKKQSKILKLRKYRKK